MKQVLVIIGIVILVIGGLIGLSFGMGWIGVGYTKTVGKAQQNAEREVYEVTQSRVAAMRTEVAKYQMEYEEDSSVTDRNAIKHMLLTDLSDFDLTLLQPSQEEFVRSLQ